MSDYVRITGYLTLPRGGSVFKEYEGPYTVIPKAFVDQMLYTNGLVMKDDVIVTEIPYFESDNVAGGKTITIA